MNSKKSFTHLLILDVWGEGAAAGAQLAVAFILSAEGGVEIPTRLTVPPALRLWMKKRCKTLHFGTHEYHEFIK